MDAGDIKVPDLTGKNLEEVKKLLEVNKLTVGKINYQPSTNVPLNAVIDQYPKANTMAKENQKIDLFINRENKKKIIIEGEEDGLKEKEEKVEPQDNGEFKDDVKKDEKKKDEKKKDDKSKPTDKKDDVKPKSSDKDKKEEKKTTPQPKDKKEGDKKNDGGTKF
ncbi:MAG: PASTA domain-containing protein [Ignavibacteria bacterium]|nr:PASTA domain-containing protein [Ignavibacteria bacterium]